MPLSLSVNPLRLDPSRTGRLRERYGSEYARRVQLLIDDIVDLIRDQDAFGLDDPADPAFNTKWRFSTNAQKIAAFRNWLKERVEKDILSRDQSETLWTERYIRAAYEQGRVRGNTQAARARRKMYEQFLTRYTKDQQRKIEQLVQESLDTAEGLTKRVQVKASRIISDGLTKGQSKNKIAKRLADELGIEKKRAKLIAHTETVRAQAEGQLDSFDEGGITHVGAMVEWRTSGRPNVCPYCKANEGKVLTINDARGLIPLHPGCNCAWQPVEARKPPRRGRGRAGDRLTENFNPWHKGKGFGGGQFTSGSHTDPLSRAPGIDSGHRQQIADLLNKDRPITIAEIVAQTGVDEKKVKQFIGKLTRKGYIKKVAGGYIEIDEGDAPPKKPREPKPDIPNPPRLRNTDIGDIPPFEDTLNFNKMDEGQLALHLKESNRVYPYTGDVLTDTRGKTKKGAKQRTREKAFRMVAEELNDLKRFPFIDSQIKGNVRAGVDLKIHPGGNVGKGNLGTYTHNLVSDNIKVIDMAGKLDDAKLDKPNTGGWASGSADGKSYFREVFRHEYGHHVWYKMLDQGQRDTFRQFYKQEHFSEIEEEISTYAKSNVQELFAEAFAIYTHKKYVRGQFSLPGMEQWMDQHIGGK